MGIFLRGGEVEDGHSEAIGYRRERGVVVEGEEKRWDLGRRKEQNARVYRRLYYLGVFSFFLSFFFCCKEGSGR